MNYNDIKMLDIGFDQNGLARVLFDNDGVYYVDVTLNKVSEKIVAGKNVGRNIYALETENGLAGYFEYDGKYMNRRTKSLGQIFRYHNGVSLVREKDNKYSESYKCYFVNENYEVISPVYLYASLFSEEGFADVVDYNGRAFVINENFERVSPYFERVDSLDNEGVLIAKTRYKDYSSYSYYQFDGEKFVCVSPEYKHATCFRNDIAIVQDLASEKYFVVDKDFNRVSKHYEEMVGFYGNPGVIFAKQDGEKVFLTSETLSEIKNTDRYWKMFKMLDKSGFNPMLETFNGYFQEEDIENKDVMNDLKVVVKDYLIHNIYRMGYDDVSDSFYIKFNRDSKIDKRVNYDKMYKWIERVVKESPDRAEELYMLSQGKILV